MSKPKSPLSAIGRKRMRDYAAQAIRCEPVRSVYGSGTGGAFAILREPLHPDTVRALEAVIRARCADAIRDTRKAERRRACKYVNMCFKEFIGDRDWKVDWLLQAILNGTRKAKPRKGKV